MGAYSYVCLYYVCAHNLNENFKVQITILFGFYYSMFLHLPNHPVWVISENRPVGSVIAFVKSLWGHGLSWLLFYHFVQRHVNSWRLKLVWGGGGRSTQTCPHSYNQSWHSRFELIQQDLWLKRTLSSMPLFQGPLAVTLMQDDTFFPQSLSHTHTHTHTHTNTLGGASLGSGALSSVLYRHMTQHIFISNVL